MIKDSKTLLKDNLIVRHYAGSHSYGTNIATSDIDIRGLFCADPVNIRTPFFNVREIEVAEEEDTKFYELTHFMKLCLECNPNIIETLWIDESDIITKTPVYDALRASRESFLSKKIAFTTTGYATAQIKRIKGHNKWINNPQNKLAPKQTDYVSLVQNFTPQKLFKLNFESLYEDHRLIPYGGDVYGVIKEKGYHPFDSQYRLNTLYEEDHYGELPLYIVKFNKQVYKVAQETWKNYWTWKDNRNKVRSELEENHGYDSKHAAHCVRLMRMGVEVMEGKGVIVKRPDAKELLEIRDGAWTYEEVLDYAKHMDDLIRNKLYKTSNLRHAPDFKLAANILMDLQDMVWNTRIDDIADFMPKISGTEGWL